ncbi:DUF2007 domain-containing protein [candidate division KSB1 bacterium]|nr:DUF2007 domain-containing protein [candidate division KSB1 bacterium]
MPFCPSCGYEYKKDVITCPDCHRTLVEKLPEERPVKDTQLISIYSLPGMVYAEMVKEALEKAGIRCIIKSDVMTSGLQSKGSQSVGGSCQILVDKKNKKKALDILHTMVDHI